MPRTKKNLLYSEVTDQFFSKMDKEITNIIEITGVFYMFANFLKTLKEISEELKLFTESKSRRS